MKIATTTWAKRKQTRNEHKSNKNDLWSQRTPDGRTEKSKDKTDPEQIKTRETGQKAKRRHIHNLQGPQGRGHRYTKQPTLYLFSSARQMFTILVKRTPRKDKENKQFGAIWA